MICVHTYITLRCDECGAIYGDEYAYGDTRNERNRIVGDARASGWTGGQERTRCHRCTRNQQAIDAGVASAPTAVIDYTPAGA